MTKKNILLIDDDALFLMLSRKLFEKEAFLENIDTLNTQDEVKAYFEERQKGEAPYPDAVFIDIDMPEISGLELARQLHASFLAKQLHTKIFILSSSISQRSALDYRDKANELDVHIERLKQVLLSDLKYDDGERF